MYDTCMFRAVSMTSPMQYIINRDKAIKVSVCQPTFSKYSTTTSQVLQVIIRHSILRPCDDDGCAHFCRHLVGILSRDWCAICIYIGDANIPQFEHERIAAFSGHVPRREESSSLRTFDFADCAFTFSSRNTFFQLLKSLSLSGNPNIV
jgi:hypothetical protein